MNYNIATEGQLAVILSNIDNELKLEIIRDIIKRRPDDYDLNPKYNIPSELEMDFKRLLINYSFEKDLINNTRDELYNDIINCISKCSGLKFNEEESQDIYSSAFYIYDFLISHFIQYFIRFFINYITKNKNDLYYNLTTIPDIKKNKDSSTVYNKKIYKNNKLSLIAANLETVINIICGSEITFEEILNNVYSQNNIIRLLSNELSPVVDFFDTMYKPLFKSSIRPLLLTNIRLNLQKNLSDDILFKDKTQPEEEVESDENNTEPNGGVDY